MRLSRENQMRAKRGAALIVDKEWLRMFPEDRVHFGKPVPIQNITITRKARKQETQTGEEEIVLRDVPKG